jgi:hypothetical protein
MPELQSAQTVYLCVPYGSHNKQQQFPQIVKKFCRQVKQYYDQ